MEAWLIISGTRDSALTSCCNSTRKTAQDFISNGVPPGSAAFNQPVSVLSRWQKPGDLTSIEKFNQDFSLYNSFSNAYYNSNQGYGDASFIRLKMYPFRMNLQGWKKKLFLQNCRIYLQAQNLLTITRYNGYDPETMSTTSLPTLRVITTGIQFTL